MASYVEKIARLQAEIAAAPAGASARVGLAKSTSNLFRDRAPRSAPRIDLKHFNRVVAFDAAAQTVDAEGMTTYAELADATLAHGAMPCVVPQLKSITVGGAMAGVGIEATSFRHGLVHDTVVAMEVLTGDGRIVICTPDNEHRDLFFGFPNSYGTLGYALKLTMRTQPVETFVQRRARAILRRRRLLCGDRRARRASAMSTFSTASCSPPTKWCCRSAASSTTRRTSATTASSASTTARCASARPTS